MPNKQQSPKLLVASQLPEAKAAPVAQSPLACTSYALAISAQVSGEPIAAASSVVAGPPEARHCCSIVAIKPSAAQLAANASLVKMSTQPSKTVSKTPPPAIHSVSTVASTVS